MAERLWARPGGSTRRAPRIRKTTSAAIRSCKPTRSTRRPGFSARTIRTCKCRALGSKSSRSCKFRACEGAALAALSFNSRIFPQNLSRQVRSGSGRGVRSVCDLTARRVSGNAHARSGHLRAARSGQTTAARQRRRQRRQVEDRLGRIAPLGWADPAGVAKLDDVAIVLLSIEIIVLVVIDAAALNDRVAAAGEIGDRLLAVRIVEFDMVKPLAAPFEVLVIDACQRLHELELSVAHPGHRDQARMRRRLAAV